MINPLTTREGIRNNYHHLVQNKVHLLYVYITIIELFHNTPLYDKLNQSLQFSIYIQLLIFKIQRRSFFRVNAELELAVKDSNGSRFLVRTDDIGGGGTSFLADNKVKMEVGGKISCWLLVPFRNGSTEHVYFEGEVVRIKKLENGRNNTAILNR